MATIVTGRCRLRLVADPQEEPVDNGFVWIARVDGVPLPKSAPRVVLVAAQHGNEPQSIISASKFVDLWSRNPLEAELVWLPCANPWGMQRASRYLDWRITDMNRLWGSSQETPTMRHVLDLVDADERPTLVMDFHGTQHDHHWISLPENPASPFVNEIDGEVLDTSIPGTLLNYMTKCRIPAFTVESSEKKPLATVEPTFRVVERWVKSLSCSPTDF